MIEFLEKTDVALFKFINGLNSPAMDFIMQQFSEKYFWIPLYVILLFPLWKKYGKRIYIPLIAIGVLITLSDQISVHLFKDVFERYRPCHNEILQGNVHLVDDHCGGRYGFVSSHASNTFALAIFMVLQIFSPLSRYGLLLIIWAAVVSYSRIYLGVHYPADVIGGAVLGTLLALSLHFIVQTLNRRFNFPVK